MDTAPFVPIGRVIKAHGLKGEVSVAALTGLPFDSLLGIEVWFVPPPGNVRNARLEGVRPGPKGPLLKLSGIETIDAAQGISGSTIVARPADLPEEVVEEEFDPVGWRVVDEQRGELGTIDEVIITGANDVWVVHGERFGEVLIPVIDDVVLDLDEDAEEIRVRLLPGLIEEDE